MRTICLTLAALLAPGLASAQAADFPSRAIRIVVPYNAGGIADLLARMVAPKLSEKYGQPVVIENRAGAGGHIGADIVAKAPADGYTLMVGTISHNGAFSMYKNLPYDPPKDLQPVVLIAESASLLVVHPSVPANTVQEFIALAKSKPGQLNYGSAGNGSAIHMATELFKYMAEVDLTHVAYKGGAPALTDLLGGQIDLMFENVATALPHVKSGKIRALGVTSPARNPSLPDVPTIAESGVPGYASVPWYTISTGSGVPADIVRKLAGDISAIIRSPEMAPAWEARGLMPLGGTADGAAKRNAVETERWTKVIKAANITVN
jgi:tripartite-type tricarboxylate transporter receptor subunit TctC